MNQASFIGNLVSDAQQRTSRDGTGQFITFTVAVNQRQPDGQQTAQYVDCVKTGDNARLVPYLTKGKRVFVTGRISARAYADRQGLPKAGLDLYVRDLELCGSNDNQPAAQAPQPQQPQAIQPAQPFVKNPPQDGQLFPQGAMPAAKTAKPQMPQEQDLPF